MAILADTSIWVAHFRGVTQELAELLEKDAIVTHPAVIGELSTGNLKNRRETLAYLLALPRIKTADFEECLMFVEEHRLHGRGIGWSDVQLLASARLAGTSLWTLDKSLHAVARTLHLACERT